MVYANGRQLSCVRDLTNQVRHEWAKLPQTLLKKLVDSMAKRCVEVIEKKGSKTHYQSCSLIDHLHNVLAFPIQLSCVILQLLIHSTSRFIAALKLA
jgi:hypothetical protein